MSTEAISGAYSSDTIYGLTYPFSPQNVKINAHTPYDEENSDEKPVASIKKFIDEMPVVKVQPEINTDDDYEYGIKQDFFAGKEENEVEFPPKYLSNFSASELSSKDIVTNALKKGYTAEQAVIIDNAQKAYKNGVLTDNPIKALNTVSFSVG